MRKGTAEAVPQLSLVDVFFCVNGDCLFLGSQMHPKVSTAAAANFPIVAFMGEGSQKFSHAFQRQVVDRDNLLLIELHTFSLHFFMSLFRSGVPISGEKFFESAFSKMRGYFSF